MINFLKRKEKLFFASLFLLFAVLFLTSSFETKFLGAVIGVSDLTASLSYLPLTFLLLGILILLNLEKNLEAIIVPTGPDGKIDRQRALAGAEVYQKNPESLVVISGFLNDGRFLGSQSSEIYRTLRRAGVPRGKIEIEGNSRDTLENVRYSSEIILREGIRKVTVATDKDHARRIGMLFQTAKDEGLVPESLEVKNYSKGIDKAYSQVKAIASYQKDFVRSVKSGKIKGV